MRDRLQCGVMARLDGSGIDSDKLIGDDEVGQPVVGPDTITAGNTETAVDSTPLPSPEPDNVTPIRKPATPAPLAVALADLLERAAGWLRSDKGDA